MKFEAFQAGTQQQRYQYKSFEPTHVNRQWVWAAIPAEKHIGPCFLVLTRRAK
jgi:hypothetical protein